MRKWLKMAGAGEFRGEGSWIPVMGAEMERDFDHCKRTGFLPVAWSVEGHERIFETARPDVWPTYVIKDGALIHQLHLIAVPILGVGDASLRYAQAQLKSIIEHLTVEGALA